MDNEPTILIVDDDPNLTKTLSDIVRLQGYAPLAAAKGKTALDRLNGQMPAVALIDLKLPDMDGLEVMREIKKRSPDTECIVLTGYGSEASAVEAVNLGAYGYMQKPYDVEELVLTIRRAVEKREAEEALRRAKKQWESTFAAMSDWVTLIDVDSHRILRTNCVGEEFEGLPLVQTVGQTCCKLVHGSEEPIPGCPLRKMLNTHQRETAELHVSEEDRWLMITIDPVMEDDGAIVGAVHIIRRPLREGD